MPGFKNYLYLSLIHLFPQFSNWSAGIYADLNPELNSPYGFEVFMSNHPAGTSL